MGDIKSIMLTFGSPSFVLVETNKSDFAITAVNLFR